MRGIINDWFHDCLSQRTQCVELSQHVSTPETIHFGVPQGSVLGPILFLLYNNDLPNIFTKLKAILFADDATLYITEEDISSITHTAHSDSETL